MNIDKFLTDLAAHTGSSFVSVEFCPPVTPPTRFRVTLIAHDPHCHLDSGYGDTVAVATTAAIAQQRQRRALDELGAIDGELLP